MHSDPLCHRENDAASKPTWQDLSEFQRQIMLSVGKRRDGIAELRARLKTNNLAIHSGCSALVRKGLLGQSRSGHDRWAQLCWYLTKDGQQLLEQNPA